MYFSFFYFSFPFFISEDEGREGCLFSLKKSKGNIIFVIKGGENLMK
jgi:hypothetical protein